MPVVFRFLARFASRPARTPRELALRALAQGAFDDADARFTALLAEPGLAPAERAFCLNKRGVARIGLALPAAARGDFEAALASDPRHAPALANLGNLHLEAGDVAAAIACYQEAIRADQACAVAHLNLGVAYKRIGRLEDAVRSLRAAQRLEGRILAKPRKPT